MILRNLIFKTEVVKQRLRAGMVSHHEQQASKCHGEQQHRELWPAYNANVAPSQASTEGLFQQTRPFSTVWQNRCHNSRVDTATLAALTFLGLLAVVSVSVSVNILLRGTIWRRLKPSSRPRRWVLILLLASLAVTLVWLPVFVKLPNTPLSRVLTAVWGIVCGGTCLIFKLPLLSSAVDLLFERRGWSVR